MPVWKVAAEVANTGESQPGFEELQTAVAWPGAARAFHTDADPTNPDSPELGTWHVLAVVDSISDTARHLGLSVHDRRMWGTDGYLALMASERTGLDVRVRMVGWDRWWSMRRVVGTVEHEFRRHGQRLTAPNRRRHRIVTNGKAAATCRYCVDFGHEQWPSALEHARDFAAVRIIELGGDAIEDAVGWALGASGHLSHGFAQKTLDDTYNSFLEALRRFLQGVLVLRSVPHRPSTEPTLVQLFDLLPPQFDRGNITREDVELFHWWKRVHHKPTRATVRRLGTVTAEMMGQVARELRKRKHRGERPLSWTLGYLVGERYGLLSALALPRWSDPHWFSRVADSATVRRAAQQLLPPGILEYTPEGHDTPTLVVVADDALGHFNKDRHLMDVLEQATGTVIRVRITTPQAWADNTRHPLAWEHQAETTGTWITQPHALPQPVPYKQACVDRTTKALARVASGIYMVARGNVPDPLEIALVLEHRPREYWKALVARLRRCVTNATRVRTAISEAHTEMNETPRYRPADDPIPVDNQPLPARGDTEPPLVAAVRDTTLRSMHACDALAREVTRYAEQTGTPVKQFRRSLETIQESTQQISSTLDGLLWVYPDGAPPRGWNPYYLNNQ